MKIQIKNVKLNGKQHNLQLHLEDTEIPQKGKYPPLHALILYKNIETSKHKCLL